MILVYCCPGLGSDPDVHALGFPFLHFLISSSCICYEYGLSITIILDSTIFYPKTFCYVFLVCSYNFHTLVDQNFISYHVQLKCPGKMTSKKKNEFWTKESF